MIIVFSPLSRRWGWDNTRTYHALQKRGIKISPLSKLKVNTVIHARCPSLINLWIETKVMQVFRFFSLMFTVIKLFCPFLQIYWKIKVISMLRILLCLPSQYCPDSNIGWIVKGRKISVGSHSSQKCIHIVNCKTVTYKAIRSTSL